MDSSKIQSVLTMLMTAIGSITYLLVSYAGCKEIAGAIDCTASTVPTWLVPYLVVIGTLVGGAKVVLSLFTGKFWAPTVPVSTTGKPGTVTADQIRK
jgi:hypothetical protein